MTIRIMLADDHQMFREAILTPLELQGDLQVVAQAGSAAEIFSQLQKLTPDVLILDIGLPGMNGVDVARQIALAHPAIKVVMLSGYTDKIFVDEAMRVGARAFVAKAGGTDELITAIRTVVAGKIYLSPDITTSLIRPACGPDQPIAPPASVLGKREQEVLRLLAEGKSSPETAAALCISALTVEAHRRNIKQKLGIHSIAELTRYAIREGLVSVQ